MTSVSAFTDMLSQFLDELVKTFPQEETLKKYKLGFEVMKENSARSIVDIFMKSAEPHRDAIMASDESLMAKSGEITFLKTLNAPNWWTPSLSANTKTCIWQYLQTLMVLGTTITAIPSETLSAIENVAAQIADGAKTEGGDSGGQFDMSALTKLFGSLGNLKLN